MVGLSCDTQASNPSASTTFRHVRDEGDAARIILAKGEHVDKVTSEKLLFAISNAMSQAYLQGYEQGETETIQIGVPGVYLALQNSCTATFSGTAGKSRKLHPVRSANPPDF